MDASYSGLANYDPPQIEDDAPDSSDSNISNLTAKARRTYDKIKADGSDLIGLSVKLGEIIAKVRDNIQHGKFGEWCRKELSLSPSSCSAYRRLYDLREDIAPAREWAHAMDHKWMNAYSVERVLKLIGEWKQATDATYQPRQKRSRVPEITKALSREVAFLQGWQKDALDVLVAVGKYLPAEQMASVQKLVAAAKRKPAQPEHDESATDRQSKDEASDICGALQVASPQADTGFIVAVSQDMAPNEAAEATEQHSELSEMNLAVSPSDKACRPLIIERKRRRVPRSVLRARARAASHA